MRFSNRCKKLGNIFLIDLCSSTPKVLELQAQKLSNLNQSLFSTSSSVFCASLMELHELPFQLRPTRWFVKLEHQQQQSLTTMNGPDNPSLSLELFIELRYRVICNWVVRQENRQTVLLNEAESPTISETFKVYPFLFLSPSFSRFTISEMISQLHIPLSRNTRGPMIQQISSYLSELIMENALSEGRETLMVSAEIVALEVLFYDEVAAVRRVIRESTTGTDRRGFGATPASKSAIEALRSIELKGGESIKSDCSICLDELEVGSEIKEMPCSHVFHGGCITRWLETSHYCPVCRFEMPI